jgi:hypothetical protein
MKKSRKIWYLFLAAILFCSLPHAAFGDLYWESLMETSGVPEGMPKNMPKEMLKQFNRSETTKNYLTSYASRTETVTGAIIIDFQTMVIYQLNPIDKTCFKIDMMSAMKSMNEQKMTEGMPDDMVVTATDEKKEIAGYMCRKYTVSMMGTTSQYWLSREVKGYKDYQEYNKKMEKIVQKIPALKQMSMAGKLDGFPVQTSIDMMGIKSTTTLTRIEKKSLSKDLFKIPKGYTVQEMTLPTGGMMPKNTPQN